MSTKFFLVPFTIITLIVSGSIFLNTDPKEVKSRNIDQKEIEKTPIILEIFGGTIEIPGAFMAKRDGDNDFINYFRDVDGTEDSGASIDMITFSLNKSKDYQVVVPSNKIFEKIEKEYKNGFLIEKWTPKKGQSFNRVLYLVMISMDNEFISVLSKNSTLWKKVLHSHREN